MNWKLTTNQQQHLDEMKREMILENIAKYYSLDLETTRYIYNRFPDTAAAKIEDAEFVANIESYLAESD